MSTEQTPQPTLMDAPQAEQTKAEATTAVAKKEKFTPELCASTINKLPPMLQPLRTTFAQPFDAFRRCYKDPEEADRIMAREIDFAAQAMMANTFLIKVATANPLSLANALKNLAQAGYTLNPVRKQAYLVPMGGAIVFVPSYMGLVDELVASGLVKKIEAHPVFEGEEFSISHGSSEGLSHKPNPWGKRDKESLKGCYWYAVLVDGTAMFDTMSVEEIEKIRRRAPSAKSSSPWDTDYIEMARKTAIRNGYKKLPKKGISEDKLKVLDAIFDFAEQSKQAWIAEQRATPPKDNFDEEVEYQEIDS